MTDPEVYTKPGNLGATQTTGYTKANGATLFGEGMPVGLDGKINSSTNSYNDEYGGGGGGWYGGLARTPKNENNDKNNAGGSGGSGFVYADKAYINNSDSPSDLDLETTLSSVKANFGESYALDSKYKLTDEKLISGDHEMPTIQNDGTTEIGHKLDGYVIITRIKLK